MNSDHLQGKLQTMKTLGSKELNSIATKMLTIRRREDKKHPELWSVVIIISSNIFLWWCNQKGNKYSSLKKLVNNVVFIKFYINILNIILKLKINLSINKNPDAIELLEDNINDNNWKLLFSENAIELLKVNKNKIEYIFKK